MSKTPHVPSQGFLCPFCKAPHTEVRDSRSDRADGRIRRRRYCENCANSFSTIEIPIEMLQIVDLRAQASVAAEAMNNAIAKFNTLRRAIKATAKR